MQRGKRGAQLSVGERFPGGFHGFLVGAAYCAVWQRVKPGTVFAGRLFHLRHPADAGNSVFGFTHAQPVGCLGYVGCDSGRLLVEAARG